MSQQSQLPLDDHRAMLMKMPSYLARPGVIADYSWRTVARDNFVVKGTKGSQALTPADFLLVGQVSHKERHLAPLGNFMPKYEKSVLERSKFVFTLEVPDDANLARDYITGVEALKQFQSSGGKFDNAENMVDMSTESDVRFVADIFRPKVRPSEEQDLPEGVVVDDPSKPDYFPTASNWPVGIDAVRPFNLALTNHVFQPLNVFYLNRGRVNPKDFDEVLPGSIVEVRFSIHAWHIKSTKLDSFNAKAHQIVVLRPTLTTKKEPVVVKKKIPRGITYPDGGSGTLKRGLDDSSSSSLGSVGQVEGSSSDLDPTDFEGSPPKKARLARNVNIDTDDEESASGKGDAASI